MRTSAILISALMMSGTAALAQDSNADADEGHYIDQLVGQWHFQACDVEPVAESEPEPEPVPEPESSCTTVQRTYEPAADGELLYYTENVGGETHDGFVGYDADTESFVEYDYPEDWSRDEFVDTYTNEQAAYDLYGEGPGGNDQVLRWQLNEEGERMSLRAPGGDAEAGSAGEFLGVVFSRVPIVGSDPIVGPGSDN